MVEFSVCLSPKLLNKTNRITWLADKIPENPIDPPLKPVIDCFLWKSFANAPKGTKSAHAD
jgi:hypothetical protein